MSALELVDDNHDLFSYAALSREDEASAREDATLIRSHVEDIAKKGIEIGQALNRQKKRMGHGVFMAWVRDECGMSDRTANRLMKVAKDLSNSPSMANFSGLGTTALELLVSDSTPQSVRDQVEELLVDGEKVTVADIKAMKAEAKAAASLAERNRELAQRLDIATSTVHPDDSIIESIKAKAEEDAERRLSPRINELAEANAKLRSENLETLKKLAEMDKQRQHIADESSGDNVVQLNAPAAVVDVDPYDDDEISEKASIGAFSGAIGSCKDLKFSPQAFWEMQGRGAHGKMLYRALLDVNEMSAALIKEYSK